MIKVDDDGIGTSEHSYSPQNVQFKLKVSKPSPLSFWNESQKAQQISELK